MDQNDSSSLYDKCRPVKYIHSDVDDNNNNHHLFHYHCNFIEKKNRLHAAADDVADARHHHNAAFMNEIPAVQRQLCLAGVTCLREGKIKSIIKNKMELHTFQPIVLVITGFNLT